MRLTITTRTLFGAAALALGISGCSDGKDATATPPVMMSCAAAATQAVQSCMRTVNAAIGACYFEQNGPCQDNNPDILAAHNDLEASIQDHCADAEFLNLSTDALVGRLADTCQSQADSLGWRTFGGPQGAIWPDTNDAQRACLQTAHSSASAFLQDAVAAKSDCLLDASCDASALQAQQEAAAQEASAAIGDDCEDLAAMVALTPQQYITNTGDQIDCTVAAAHADTAALGLSCGPSNVDAAPARGQWTQIVLDSNKWGTMCGDGSEYAIHVRLAPEGEPLDRVLVGLQGGGVCLFEEDCKARFAASPDLFNAQDDLPLGGGIASDDPDNPFANWTKVYLPYCNQDVFIGGGIVEDFGELQLPRYGTINLRAGMRVVRDIIWQAMDAGTDTGYRPDELIALFGGFSAGGYGALYNYHWVLDDLLWPRTAAYPDAGGALDNGSVAGVRGLGFVKIPAWGAQPYLPPYCFSGDCAVGPDNYRAFSPRLKQVPQQQFLIVSNQKDNTQQGDAFFDDEAQWIDAMRAAYCDTKDLPGIQWYLTSDSVNSVHVVSVRDEFYYGAVAGERMVDWFWRAVTDPDSVEDRAEEGNFTTDIPGSNPFPCELPL
jgi:hypothetical protein